MNKPIKSTVGKVHMKNFIIYLILILLLAKISIAQTLGVRAGISFPTIYEKKQPGPEDKIEEHKTNPNITLALSLNWVIFNNFEIEYEPGVRVGSGKLGGVWIVHIDSNDIYGSRKYYFVNFDNNILIRYFLLSYSDIKGIFYLGTGFSLNLFNIYYYDQYGMSEYEDPFFIYNGFYLSIGTSFNYKNLTFEFRLTRELFPMSISGRSIIKNNLFMIMIGYNFN